MGITAINPGTANISRLENTDLHRPQATVLLATNDPEIHGNMSELLAPFSVKTVWAKGVEEVKYVLGREKVSVCFCGFWLLDGTYRDVLRHLRLQRAEIPVVIVCAPSCPHDYREYLAALNISAFDFICHPYRKSDVERVLNSAMNAPLRPPSSVPPARASELRKAS
jgi:DNA-binding NtrC family response regulator